MAKVRVETYEQGTGRLLAVREVEVEDVVPSLTDEEIIELRKLLAREKVK